MSELAWIDAALTAARPQAVSALLRYFRDLDRAEEAYQDACLRALRSWPRNGPPRDPAAWLILVGRNAALDAVRHDRRSAPLPDEAALSDIGDAEAPLVERLDDAHYRDDILRLMFVCCHPDLPVTQQIALALRIVSGLSVKQIARAFLVGEAAMEQRITRAKARISTLRIPFETPDEAARSERLRAVAAMVYLLFNDGYAAGPAERESRAPLALEAIRLARLLMHLFPYDPEVMGLAALLLLQQSRAKARFDGQGHAILLEDQDRTMWDSAMIAEGLVMIDKAMRHGRTGPYLVQAAIAALHARARHPDDTDWRQIEALYATLERLQPSPVVTLNRSVATSLVHGAEAALALIEPLADPLSSYLYFHGTRGTYLMQLGRRSEAREAFGRALTLATTLAEAVQIRTQLDRLTETGSSAGTVDEKRSAQPSVECRRSRPAAVLEPRRTEGDQA